MKIVNLEASLLAQYCRAQIVHNFPNGDDPELALIDTHLPEALRRLEQCVDDITMWRPGVFDILHSSQYCIFLYFLANSIWRNEHAKSVCTKLFLLNKKLNAIDCFYEIELPDVFFIGHSVGIVLAKATYGNHLVLYQNSTIGRNHETAPILGKGVVLYPNTAIIGSSLIADGSIVSQGVSVINKDTKAGNIAYQGANGSLVFKQPSRNILADFFRSKI